ncbi:MAG TPA: YedE-related selenium metabolism membrane protein [Thermoanaerobacterales bacterium]|jgi:YedE family putative selenium metabolism protein|nr:YedE-related selenium metabolism membrane protein [Thermoanaerobacterales bacterium]
MDQKKVVIAAGSIVGALSVALMFLGNPPNMGICVACFIRDIAGALGLHRAEIVQYMRPEIPGFILGAFIISLISGEFYARGGSSPLTRFILGFFVMIGSLVFLGCPLRMVLRLAAGDWNAIIGILGFIVGIWVGLYFLRNGFSLGRSYKMDRGNGYIMPGIAIVFLIFGIISPAFIFHSVEGPGSMNAPFIAALLAGLIVGALAQRSRLCMAGSIRDIFLIGDFHLFKGFASIFIVALVLNIVLGKFNPGFVGQPVAHNDFIWNFLGMFLTGYGAVLLGGCPLRQCILSGEGDTDAAVTFMGMLVGAAFSHNFAIAASPKGVGPNGKIAVIVGIIVLTVIAYLNISKSVKQNEEVNVNA